MNEFTVTLDMNDLQVIGAALGEMPMKISRATFDKINSQVAAAQQQKPEVPPDTPPAD